MKPTDWDNTAKFVQKVQRNAALEDSNQLGSSPLSELSLDLRGPPTVLEGALAPLSTSMPVCLQQDNQLGADDIPDNQPFQQIIPGISHISLYPALSALSSKVSTQTGSTIFYYEQVINDIEEQERVAFATTTEGWHRSTNTTPVPDVDFQLEDSPGENTLSLESLVQDTGNDTINAIQEPGSDEQDHLSIQTAQDSADNIITVSTGTRTFKHR